MHSTSACPIHLNMASTPRWRLCLQHQFWPSSLSSVFAAAAAVALLSHGASAEVRAKLMKNTMMKRDDPAQDPGLSPDPDLDLDQDRTIPRRDLDRDPDQDPTPDQLRSGCD